MKKIVLGLVVSLLFAGCASMNLENYVFQGETSEFSTDFSSADRMRLDSGAEVSNGTLHVSGEGNVELDIEYGRGSITRFKAKGADASSEVYYNLLVTDNPGSRLATILRPSNVHVFADANGESVLDSIKDTSTLSSGGDWREFVIVMTQDEYILFVDGKRKTGLTLPTELPKQGGANFEYHNEYWIDDYSVSLIDGYMVE